jgi:glutamate dehydrogenase/leucine dehydrogenase
LFINKNGNKLNTEGILPFHEVNDKIWDMGADIFIPGAASKLVTREQVDKLIEGNLEVLAAGANVPFVDDKVFFGPTARYADTKFSIIPDFIANCGMARVFAYLMQPDVSMTDKAIFGDVSNTIKNAILDVYKENPSPYGISIKALEIALEKLL